MSKAGRIARFGAAVAVVVLSLASFLEVSQAAFPGYNGFIAYQGETGLFAARPEGGPIVPITQGDDSNPAWSPTGQRILFDRDLGGQREIFVTSFPSDGATRLTDDPADDRDPAWSPDGTSIVFASGRNGGGLFTMNVDGSNVTQITNVGGGALRGDAYPVWSPDGSKIAFTRGLPEFGGLGYSAIMTVSPGGDNLTTISGPVGSGPSAGGRVHQLNWSPDGSMLVFGRGGSACSGRVAVMNADGTGGRYLVAPGDADFPIPDGCIASEPAWSPDGRKIVLNLDFRFGGPSEGATGTYTVNPDGTGLTKLPFDGYVPDWQPLGGTSLPSVPSTTSLPPSTTTTVVDTTTTTTVPTADATTCAQLRATRADMDASLRGPAMTGFRALILSTVDGQLIAAGC